MVAVIVTMLQPNHRPVTRTFRVGDTHAQADEYQANREEAGATLIKRIEVEQ